MILAMATDPIEPSAIAAQSTLEAALVRLLKDIPDGKVSETARRAKMSSQALFRLRRGENLDVRLSTFSRLADALERPITWPALPVAAVPSVTIKGDEFVAIEGVIGQVGAGPARLDPPDNPKLYAFHQGWLKRRHLKGDHLIAVTVARGAGGESMEPTIRPGSVLVVDRGPKGEGVPELLPADEGRVFLVKHPEEEGMKVKRVYRSGSTLIFWSDNPTTKPRVEAVPVKGRDLKAILLGRVVWVGRDEE